jgi:predicted peptidase
MGGAGTWGLAAAQPERFSAIVPVCGFGPTAVAEKVKGLPIWSFLGDADSDRIVRDTRALLDALREAGAKPKQTEYRGIGHNSWDRAYNEPGLVEWVLAQRRQARP